MEPKDAALRKRTQIAKANRMMFIWVAIVSVIVGFALVGAIFLIEKLFFNERVLAAKQKTVTTLQADNAIIPKLEDQVRVLDTNTALNSIKASPTDQAVQVILDALPSDANSLALGASLQNKLLANISPTLKLTSLEVDPVVGIETSTADAAASVGVSTPASAVGNAITFTFAVTGTPDDLKQVLTNLEKSIRAIDVVSLQIASETATTDTMTVQGQAFYEPSVVVQLKNETID
jgi:hypothetical protein